MSKVIDFFNNNVFLSSIFTLIFSAILTIFINWIERKSSRRQNIKDKEKSEFENRAEFRIVRNKRTKPIDIIKLVYLPFSESTDSDGYPTYNYDKRNKNFETSKSVGIMLENIGHANICELYIRVNDGNKNSIIERCMVNALFRGKFQNSIIGYFNKILPGETLFVNIYYCPELVEFKLAPSELTIYYRDSYGNFYYQPLFLCEKGIEGPYRIDNDKFIRLTRI